MFGTISANRPCQTRNSQVKPAWRRRERPAHTIQRCPVYAVLVNPLIDCQPRWRERLGQITAPTLVVHGDEDPFFPYRNGVALAAEIPGATLLTLPGIGQGVPCVTWPAVVDALLRHTS
jgi:pimeloyl-ACP methyl ester carboxylesterase